MGGEWVVGLWQRIDRDSGDSAKPHALVRALPAEMRGVSIALAALCGSFYAAAGSKRPAPILMCQGDSGWGEATSERVSGWRGSHGQGLALGLQLLKDRQHLTRHPAD